MSSLAPRSLQHYQNTHSHTQLGLHGSSRHSNGFGSQTLSLSARARLQPLCVRQQFPKESTASATLLLLFLQKHHWPLPTTIHAQHYHFWETQSSHLQLQLIQEYDIQSCQVASRPTAEAEGLFSPLTIVLFNSACTNTCLWNSRAQWIDLTWNMDFYCQNIFFTPLPSSQLALNHI